MRPLMSIQAIDDGGPWSCEMYLHTSHPRPHRLSLPFSRMPTGDIHSSSFKSPLPTIATVAVDAAPSTQKNPLQKNNSTKSNSLSIRTDLLKPDSPP